MTTGKKVTLYLSQDRAEHYDTLRGRTFVITRLDFNSQPYAEKITIPQSPAEFGRIAFDHLMDLIANGKELETA